MAVIRIPRERMIGHGIASSLVHEVGHQAAALLGLVESLRPVLQEVQKKVPPDARAGWTLWERWISEIVADFWAIARVGISSTLGLIGIVSLPRRFVFRINVDDPHPFPWIRVKLSCVVGNALFPHVQWKQLARVWESFYPLAGLDSTAAGTIASLQRTMPDFVRLLMHHRPASLRGRTLRDVAVLPGRSPAQLLELYKRWVGTPQIMKTAAPTLVFAVFGRARIAGRMTPEEEDRVLGKLITHWALKSTLDLAAICADQPWRVRRPISSPSLKSAVAATVS